MNPGNGCAEAEGGQAQARQELCGVLSPVATAGWRRADESEQRRHMRCRGGKDVRAFRGKKQEGGEITMKTKNHQTAARRAWPETHCRA